MIKLLLAVLMTFPAVLHAQKEKPIEGKPVSPVSDPLDTKNPNRSIPHVLSAMLAKDPKTVGAAMASRFADFLVLGDEGGYIAPATRKDESSVKFLKATPKGWVDALAANNEHSKVAVLYLVLGTGSSDTSWAKADPQLLDALPRRGPYLDGLIARMKPWTGQGASGRKAKGPVSASPVDALAFLEDAAAQAKALLEESRVTKKAVIPNLLKE